MVGNYFKPIRASRLMAQAQETQRGKGNLNLDFTCRNTSSLNFTIKQFGRHQTFQAPVDWFGIPLLLSINFQGVHFSLIILVHILLCLN